LASFGTLSRRRTAPCNPQATGTHAPDARRFVCSYKNRGDLGDSHEDVSRRLLDAIPKLFAV
jgi:hypothetical protein